MYRMKILGFAEKLFEDPGPCYLESFDPEFANGQGAIDLTRDPSKALTFPTLSDVFETWRRPSATRPCRADGKPNRPLTTFTIEPEIVP